MTKPLRRPNGYGTIIKRSGRRRNPYEIRITAGFETYIDAAGQLKTKQIQKTLESFPDYNSAALALALYNENPYDPALKNITFAQAYDSFLKDNPSFSEKNLSKYRTVFKKTASIHKKQIVKITKQQLQSLVEKEKTETTQNQMIHVFSPIFKWCVEKGILKTNPAQGLYTTAEKTTTIRTPYSADELKSLWRALPTMHYIDAILIQIYTGMRANELLTLQKDFIHLDERWAHVFGTKNENADRDIPLRKEIIPLLRRRMQNNDSMYLFPSKTKKDAPITYEGYVNQFKKIMVALNFRHHVTHDARHTFITNADDSNINKTSCKMIVGHARDGVTEKVYTHKTMENLIGEVDKIKFF